MSEHARVKDFAGISYQFVDQEMCMILDVVTGEPQRFGPGHNSIGTIQDALKYATESPQAPPRYVIVKIQSIAPYKIGSE